MGTILKLVLFMTRMRLRKIAREFRRDLKVYQLTYRDPRTPRAARLLLAAAMVYTLLPFDLIPNFLPIIGHLDDAIIVSALVIGALRMIPHEVITDCRNRLDAST